MNHQTADRLSTGVPALDEHLGGGLIPGTMTVILGATGIGKTQLGTHFTQTESNDRGIIFDMSSRGDGQNHFGYTQRMYGRELQSTDHQRRFSVEDILDVDKTIGDYLHVFDMKGNRVTKRDLDFDQWREWQAELNTKLHTSIGFLFGNFVRGVRRVVVDGVEPADKSADSIQLNLFEYIYHQVLRKESEWVARDLFRENFRAASESLKSVDYDPSLLACQVLWTSKEMMLDDLIAREIDEGDVLSNANTMILMGKIKQGNKIGRALFIAKHRGSFCSDEIIPYQITDKGIELI